MTRMARPVSRLVPHPLILALAIAFAPQSAKAILIDTGHGGDAYGNSSDGGHSPDPSWPTSGNTLDISSSGSVSGYAYGAYHYDSSGAASANGNTLNSSGMVSESIYGAYAGSDSNIATVSDNRVHISGGSVGGNVYGAYAESDSGSNTTASDNHVYVSGGTVERDVSGGYAYNDSSGTAAASGNRVHVSGSSINAYSGYTYSGYAYSYGNTATASDNHVYISDGSASWAVGGYAGSDNNTATASDNHVYISGGSVFRVIGGETYSDGHTATASNNRVQISGGTVTEHVHGGYADSDGTDQSSNAIGNFVVISGGDLQGNIYGGYSLVEELYSEIGKAMHNTVTLSGQPTFGATSALYGGFVGDGGTPDSGMDAFSGIAFEGNRLNVENYSGNSILKGVHNFQHYFFDPGTNRTALKAETVNLTNGPGETDIGTLSSDIGIGTVDGRLSTIRPGDRITLIEADRLITVDGSSYSQPGGRYRLGVGVDLPVVIYVDTVLNTVHADIPTVGEIGQATLPPQTRAFPNGYLSGLILASQGVDLAAGKGMAVVQDALRRGRNSFVFLEGGSSRYKTGSHIDVDGKILMAGLAGEASADPGIFTLSAFLAHGRGNYDTRNGFADARVKGRGEAEYTGFGLLGRLDLAGTDAGHPYVEASLQGGRVKSDFRADEFTDAQGQGAKYDSSSNYHGAHLAAGYVWNFAHRGQLDLHGQVLHARRGGERTELNTGDLVRFGAVASQRVRIGGRYTWANENVKPYVGLAWEHEFDGKARATITPPTTAHRLEIDAPRMKGDTGIVELGFTFAPGKNRALTVDLGIQGYAGRRDGVSGGMRVEYRF